MKREGSMTQTLIKMSDLYDRLLSIGFPQEFVKQQVLPDWWCPEFEESDGAVIEAASYAARRLNLDLSSILDNQGDIVFAAIGKSKYKSQQGSDIEKMAIPTALSHRIAELVAYACRKEYQSLEQMTVKQIREHLMESYGIISLESLLNFCWQRGIAVVHCDNFPKTTTKFHGMATWVQERPVIIISLNDLSPSRLLFIVAHELGHIYKRHVSSENEFMMDQKIDLGSLDEEEVEANEFACELLLGKANMSYYFPNQYNGQGLAQYCQKIATRDRLSPGLIAWNYAWSRGQWSIARKALKILEPDSNAPNQINHHLQDQLDWEKLSEDNQDHLRSFSGLEDN
jgi:Zn-dependent peptidase ImmA (M78 family)